MVLRNYRDLIRPHLVSGVAVCSDSTRYEYLCLSVKAKCHNAATKAGTVTDYTGHGQIMLPVREINL